MLWLSSPVWGTNETAFFHFCFCYLFQRVTQAESLPLETSPLLELSNSTGGQFLNTGPPASKCQVESEKETY